MAHYGRETFSSYVASKHGVLGIVRSWAKEFAPRILVNTICPGPTTPRCWGYGPKVAIPRIVESYRQLGLSQTLFIPAWCIEQYPEAIETILKGGHEIARHGFLHEHPRELSDDEEAHWLDRGIEVIAHATGRRPRGWRAPLYNFSHRSADLLADRGFAYDASLMGDDQPYLLDSARGRLVELPSHWGLDDWPQYVQSMDLDYMMPVLFDAEIEGDIGHQIRRHRRVRNHHR